MSCAEAVGEGSTRARLVDGAPNLLDERWDGVRRLALDAVLQRFPRVVVTAYDPGKVISVLGATLADLADAGVRPTLVVATGEPPDAAMRRSSESGAFQALGGNLVVTWWVFDDTGPSPVDAELRHRLIELAGTDTLLIVPTHDDQGGALAGRASLVQAAHATAQATSAALLQYPGDPRAWGEPRDPDWWSRVRLLAPSLAGLRAKRAALHLSAMPVAAVEGQHQAPTAPHRAACTIEALLLPQPRDLAARLDDAVAEHRRRTDIGPTFDVMLSAGQTDPWHLDDSIYERRRIALLLASLGRPKYSKVLEIGCATGQLCARLATITDHVTGMDASPLALAVARRRTESVHWMLGAAPGDIPNEEFDLIVLSEVTYFLDGPELLATLRAARRRLRAHGEMVVANWLGPTEQIPLDGASASEQVAAVIDLPLRAHYQDADLRIDVWGEPTSVHSEYGI